MEDGYYWLHGQEDEPVVVYYYTNPDTQQKGFGFNIADGCGFLPEYDLKEGSKLTPVEPFKG